MNIKHYLSTALLFFTVLLWSCKNDVEGKETATVQPGTSLFYYNSGLDTSNFEEKLRLYNKGLELEKEKIDTVLPSLIEGKVYALRSLGKIEEGKSWSDSLLKASEVLKDTYYLAKGNYWLFRYYNESNQVQPAFKHLFRSKQLFLEIEDSASAGWRSMDMAYLKYDTGDLTGAQESSTEALKLLDKEEYPYLISGVINIIGLSYMDRGFYDEAIKEYQNALSYSVNKRDSLVFLHNWALALNEQKKYDESLEIFEKLLKSDAPTQQSMSRYINNYAYTLWSQDSTRQVDSLFFEALERREEAEDLYGLSDSYSDLSEYYFSKDKAKSKRYAQLFLEAARELHYPSYELMALKKMMELSSPQEAKEYMDRYVFLEDSLDQAQLKAKFTFAKVEFDEKQKQEQILELRETTKEQAWMNQRLKWRNAFITVLFIFSALLVLVLFYYFRQRARKKNLREVYQTESRIARRIHDELANDLYGVMSRLGPAVPEQTVDRLEKIYRRTRDISRENAEIDTGGNFPAFLTSMLSDQTGSAKLIVRGDNAVKWDKLSEEKKIVLYRVLQELMVNMKKHSDTKLVAIVFDQKPKLLEVQYSDTGKGAASENFDRGNGLKNVKKRLSSVGGKIALTTREGEGFKARISIPL
ncbi:MAG: ATP-binding protein [Salinimicrobium sp.]